jgi:hypothetical protein
VIAATALGFFVTLLLRLAALAASSDNSAQRARTEGPTTMPLHPMPRSLVTPAKRLFGLQMPPEQVMRATVFRPRRRLHLAVHPWREPTL